MTRLPRILYAVPQTLHAHLEIAKAIRALAASDDQHFERNAALTKHRSDRELIAEIVRDAWRVLGKTGYNPNEPRVPAGNPDGGQWTSDGGNGTSTSASDNAGEGATDVRLAMEPTDPATGAPFSSESPINRLGGGEGPGGGGFGGRSASVSTEAAAADAQGAGPPQIGAFIPPDSLTYGTTLFGNYAHEKVADLLKELYPGVTFDFRVLPSQRGIDVEVPDDFVGQVGYQFGEIKPRTPSGEARFNRQLQEWGVGPVQAITYDATGNVYYGFR